MSKAKPIFMRQVQGRLIPVSAYDAELIADLPSNADLRITVSSTKNAGLRRLFFAGASLLHENLNDDWLEMFPTTRSLIKGFLEKLGYTEKEYRLDGSYVTAVNSLAMDAMDDVEFSEMLEKCRALSYHLFGFDAWQVWIDERENRKNGN